MMSTHYSQDKGEWLCVDLARDAHFTSSNSDNNGALLYATEMEGGAGDEGKYPHDREIGCTLCGVKSNKSPSIGAGIGISTPSEGSA